MPEKEIKFDLYERFGITRRFFFYIGLGGFLASILASFAGMARFFFPNVLFEPPTTFPACFAAEHPIGKILTEFKEEYNILVIHSEEGIYAIDATCTHLGCATNWFEDEKLFICPCHGSIFTIQGDVVAGPAPEPLYRASVSINAFGQVVVNKAVKENKPGEREKENFLIPIKG